MSRRHSDSRDVTTTPVDHSAEILPPYHKSGDPVAETSIFRSKNGGLNILGFATRLGLQALENKRADRLREEQLERERLAREHELSLRRMDVHEIETQARAEQIRAEAEAQADVVRQAGKQESNQLRNRLLGLMEEKLRASVGMNKKAE